MSDPTSITSQEFPLLLSGVHAAADQQPAARTMPQQHDLPDATFAPPGYVILREVGRGGMGVVYQAKQLTLDRLVAIKVMLAGQLASPVDRLRLRLEAETVARIRHPNVVQVYEVGEHAGFTYVVLEWVEGGTLHDWLHARGGTVRQRVELIKIVAQAVHAVHQAGIVHRDLKPGNVLLCHPAASPAGPQDTQGRAKLSERRTVPTPKLTDFGLAKRADLDANLTGTGVVVGTPNYMAPEQARANGLIGPPADIYALGALLYHCLAGQPPYHGYNSLDVLIRMQTSDPEPLERVKPPLPRDLAAITMKCLQRSPQQRYESAAALAADLDRWLAGKPVLARPVSPLERLARWMRRRPAVAGLTLGLVLLAFASLISITWLYLRADQARAESVRIARDEEAVVAFFVRDLLGQARPELAQGKLNFLDVLDRAETRIATAFREQPLIEARIRGMLGDTYTRLGQYPRARQQLEAALRSFAACGASTAPAGLETQNHLATLIMLEGKPREAEQLAQTLEQTALKHLGPQHRTLLTIRHTRVLCLMHLRRMEQALQLARENLQAGEQLPITSNSPLPDLLAALTLALYEMNRDAEAEPYARRCLELSQNLRGDRHPDTLNAVNNLALIIESRGDLPAAAALYRQSWNQSSEILGPQHPYTLVSQSNLANVLLDLGQAAEARTYHQACLASRLQSLPSNHPEIAWSYYNLGRACAALDDWESAWQAMAKALECRQQAESVDQAALAATYSHLGHFSTMLGRFVQAEDELRTAERLYLQLPTPAATNRLHQVRTRLATLYTWWGRPDAAASVQPAP